MCVRERVRERERGRERDKVVCVRERVRERVCEKERESHIHSRGEAWQKQQRDHVQRAGLNDTRVTFTMNVMQ